MQKSVLLAPTINKYTTNDLTLGNPRDYFRLSEKYLLEVVKSEPSNIYEKSSEILQLL